MKKFFALSILSAAIALSACSADKSGNTAAGTAEKQAESVSESSSESKGESEPKHLDLAVSFAYPSLDTHKEYYGWFTSVYGVTESLFKMGDDYSVEPMLASEGSAEGNVWTVKLKENVKFSNGNPLKADMVVRNLERAASENSRFAYLADFEISAKDDYSFTVKTPQPYPTLLNDLASPELGMLDLDATTDFDSAPVGTGAFIIDKFIPEGDTSVKKNENYWNGEVKLESAVFHYMQDDDTKLLAMQNGEIDGYNSVSQAAREIYEQDPETYVLKTIPGTRLQFYILNENTMDDDLRAAVNQAVDKETIAAFLKGSVSAAEGPFSASADYGKVNAHEYNPEKAMKLLDEAGYTKGADGMYTKDGKPVSLNICYYPARSLDTVALLIQEQLKAAGIASELSSYEDPDSTYIKNADFDIALYCMIADKSSDPYYFIDSTLRKGSYYNVAGFENEECEALIDSLKVETDPAKRAELANSIVQIAIDDNAFGYTGIFNKTTVLRKGVSGFAENSPFDFYGINVDTDIE